MPADQKLDVLAFAAHPDDVELCAGGTVCKLTGQGYAVGIVDLTRGELGSRGSAEIRASEAMTAAGIMNVAVRENLGLSDGDIKNTPENRILVIEKLRRYRPDILFINAPECRHPDHGAAARLVADSVFSSGLSKVETRRPDGGMQSPWRPHHILHYMQSLPFEPTLVVDVSDVWSQRLETLAAFGSQFYNPAHSRGPSLNDRTDDAPTGAGTSRATTTAELEGDAETEGETFISNPAFFHWIEARARTYGYRIGATYGEPFLYRHGPIGTDDLVAMLQKEKVFR